MQDRLSPDEQAGPSGTKGGPAVHGLPAPPAPSPRVCQALWKPPTYHKLQQRLGRLREGQSHSIDDDCHLSDPHTEHLLTPEIAHLLVICDCDRTSPPRGLGLLSVPAVTPEPRKVPGAQCVKNKHKLTPQWVSQHPQTHIPPVPQTVPSWEVGVFAGIIKVRIDVKSAWIQVALNPGTGRPQRRCL